MFWSSTSGCACGVHELQVLGDELQIDEPAAHLLQVPDVLGALLLGDALAHVAHVGGDLGRDRAASRSAARIAASTRARSGGGPAMTRARVSAMCSHVQASLGLIVDEARELRGDRPLAGRRGAAACRPRRACPRPSPTTAR